MNMRIIISGFSFLLLVACGDQGFDVGSLDLSRYSTNLSEAPAPAYVSLMTPENNGVIPSEVKTMVEHFADKSREHLVVSSIPGVDVKVRVMAMAKSMPVVQINLGTLRDDSGSQGWNLEETRLVFEEVLKKNHTENTVFFVREEKNASLDWKAFDGYRAIVEVEPGQLRPNKDFMSLDKFVPLPELMTYAEKLGETNGISKEDADKAAILLFVFAPHESFLTVIESVFDKSSKIKGSDDKIVDSVCVQLQTRNVLKKSNFDFREKMRKLLLDPSKFKLENIKLADLSVRLDEFELEFSDWQEIVELLKIAVVENRNHLNGV